MARIAADWGTRWPLTTEDDYAGYFQAVDVHAVDAVLRHCAEHLVVIITGDAPAIAAAGLH